ncbi:MAG: diguanylate cyclase [Proteobacteria bacterium]|nr:diguanylate cyclase [Pseudomonadota bacterium]
MKAHQLAMVHSETASAPEVSVWIHDPFLKELYSREFSHCGFHWRWEIRPKNWKLLLKKTSPLFLILDLALFSENPTQAIQEIKSLSPLTKIIVLSHTDDVNVAISAFKSGITDYYLKPTNPETLICAVEKMVSQQNLTPHDPSMQADLEMFSITHHIGNAETDSKMRELAIGHMLKTFDARGALWLCPVDKMVSSGVFVHQNVDQVKYAVEHWGFGSSREAHAELRAFQKQYPLLIKDSFLTHLTSHPERWFREDSAWIPLKNASMGGILISGISKPVSAALEARTEFLVRSLEVSLENHRRFIEAKQLTYIDDLTGLYNPRFLDHALTIAIDSLKNKEEGFCVLFIDIDRFKQVNDQHGHLVGSQMLNHVGRLIKTGLRKCDHVFRYGGDEFIAILYGTKIPAAKEIAERLRKATENRVFQFPGLSIKVTLSIGIARFPEHGLDKSSIITMADNAMYSSKKSGRNQVIVAEP